MDFDNARPDVVRAINQRWLLNFWARHLNGSSVPAWQAAESEDLSRIAANLSFLSIVGDNGAMRFLVTSHGAMLARVYGAADCRGRYLDDILPPSCIRQAITPYRRVVTEGRPVYTIQDVTDRQGRIVHFERLLLPFSSDGSAVDRILASLEFICVDGAYDGNELLASQTTAPIQRLSAMIATSA